MRSFRLPSGLMLSCALMACGSKISAIHRVNSAAPTVLAAHALRVGDEVHGSEACVHADGKSIQSEVMVRVLNVNADTGSVFVKKRTFPGANGTRAGSEWGYVEKKLWMQAKDLPDWDSTGSTADQCARLAGTLEQLDLVLGHYDACRIRLGARTVWYGAVPFAVLRSEDAGAPNCKLKRFEILSYNSDGRPFS